MGEEVAPSHLTQSSGLASLLKSVLHHRIVGSTLCCPRYFAQKRATAAGSRDAKRKAKMAGVTTVVLKSNVRKFTRRR